MIRSAGSLYPNEAVLHLRLTWLCVCVFCWCWCAGGGRVTDNERSKAWWGQTNTHHVCVEDDRAVHRDIYVYAHAHVCMFFVRYVYGTHIMMACITRRHNLHIWYECPNVHNDSKYVYVFSSYSIYRLCHLLIGVDIMVYGKKIAYHCLKIWKLLLTGVVISNFVLHCLIAVKSVFLKMAHISRCIAISL